jgi:hypothetical protein
VNHAERLVDRSVAIWNEPAAELRSAAVSSLWTEDALRVFQPPQEVLDAAATLNVGAVFEARGHAELEARVARAHEQFVASGEFSFRLRGNAARVVDVVRSGRWSALTGRWPRSGSSSWYARPTAGRGSTTSSSRVESLARHPLSLRAMDFDAGADHQ